MYVFVGFSEEKRIILEARNELDKFEMGIFLQIEHKTLSKINIENKQDLTFFNFNDYYLISYHNASLFSDLFDSFQLDEVIRKIFFFFNLVNKDPTNQNSQNYIFLKEYFMKKLQNINYISSAFEICLFIIAHIVLGLKLEKRICFNLPGGAGKTFCIDWLQNMFRNNIVVTTPTSKASIHYKTKPVKTIHSTFRLDPNELKFSNYNLKESIVIFDESSMLSLDILNSLKYVLQNKIVYFVGDFAQLNPVLSKNIMTETNLKIINSSDDFFLPRFNNISYIHLLNIIRNKILNPLHTVDINEIKRLFEKFKLKSSQEIYTKFVKEAKKELRYNINQIKNKTFEFKNNQPIVSSNNYSSKHINDSITSNFPNEFHMGSTIFVSKKSWESEAFREILKKELFKKELKFLGEKIILGSKVLCKKNLDLNLYNGFTGIIIEIEKNNTIISKEVILEKKTKNRIIQKKICIYDDDLFNVKLKIKSLENNEIVDMKAIPLKISGHTLRIFYLRPYYCTTLHQMQGSTVRSGTLYSLDDVLDNNILKNFYVLISRCKSFNRIILSFTNKERVYKKLIE